ncbi:bifunctional tetrahydrofolate synthase/dihydrofolate synthase [Nocardia cyriacigeorgica]|uniref:Dihydrofolate synthase/folylpolyglutamate synthase n=3 Tax=Nocardia TaxID=1817 RepID=H6R6P4_NOCCG|nr:putative folylpolyglutamate synthase FolC [Nocardia cyriacigeorgica]BDU05302.1 putative folylpolyglutamate synthase FolC [Nocardia cyriacigeorgica]CCF62207.1 folylpolyglutamate synthetase [Nocardia cyriacigeorgica GUH-2]
MTGPDETDGPDFAREAGNAEPEPQHGTGAPLGSGPSPVDLAEMALVEAELDRRWPETKIEPSLTRIATLMDLLGSPQQSYPAIHIAGTNGKTSVTRMIDALLTALHRRTGRITSPHLQLATERISIDNAPITPARYVEVYRELAPYIEMIDQQSAAAGGPAMSKFEVLTGMAYAAFAEAPVDVAVVETGMGGTWDATNVIDGQVAVITPIGLDHTEYLGPDLTAIAREKAGIIKRAPESLIPRDNVAVIAEQDPEAMDVLLRRAVEVDAAVAREGAEFRVLARKIAVGGQQLELQGLGGVYDEIFLPLHGEHQARNAVLALAAVEAFFGAGAQRQLDVDAVRAGFASVTSPGRLERMRSAPTIFIDAAHNPAGAKALAATLTSEFDFRKLVGVVAVLGDKDAAGILEALEPVFDEIVVTTNGSPRALDVDSLTDLAVQRFGDERVVPAYTLPDALETAIAIAEDVADTGEMVSGAGVIVTGSVVTAGAARALFGKEPA